jgi:hypothetical protein
MGTRLNPFSGTLDFTGSGGGGGGTSYIDGSVATPADLPITVDDPALDAVYLCKAASGVWLINRKPAGLYCRTANSGALSDWYHLGAFPEVNADGNWRLYATGAPTRELQIELTNNETLTFKMTGADAVVRTVALPVS